ncbi:cell wall-binding repeat-containing protein [Herbiconiux moechotypicola]|uniref:Uncharacterized protein n=1 Tax=Herbiconiux moechotypicola TaxID=637393 RepID=A0ABN3DUZ2_9MICO|nr:cell wall-binding repeat-containing protein [Herbiconiux moechotypicola]MCS5730999.1 cell wall-binding repeat-containing protein [Herbiconiux moechotypicola]
MPRTAPLPLRRRRALSSVVALSVAALLCSAAALPPADGEDAVLPASAPRMGEYDVAAYTAAAEEVPADLAEAVGRDLGETPEEYLARADAAADAGDVVAALQAAGVELLDSRLEGTELVVNVPDQEAAAVAESAGARAEVGAPNDETGEPDYSGVRLEALAEVIGGQGFQFKAEGYTYVCSVGFTGRYKPYPQTQFITSGHCIEPDHDAGTYYYESKQSAAGTTPSAGSVIGAPLADQYRFGGGADVGAVAVSPDWSTAPKVSTWGGGTGALGQGTPVTITDLATAVKGSPVCKSGRTTGWTCGEVLVVNGSFPVYNHAGTPVYVNLTLTDVCMLPGDSGASALIGRAAFGVGTAGNFSGGCSGQPDAISAFFPLATTDGTPSVSTALPNWELGVSLAAPVYQRPSFTGDAITGTLANAGPRHRVVVTIDSSTFTVTPDSSGAWSVPIPSALQKGKHTFTVRSTWGAVTSSAVATDSYELAGSRPAVQRIAGATRYDVAVTVSQRAFPGTAPVVYLADGSNYPDALSAAPAALAEDGPLLLTPRDALPAQVSAEIARLKPQRVVVVGGPSSVSDAVLAQLRASIPTVTRIAGADRYAVSRLVAETVFGTAAKSYVATGANFPDALSVSSAAGAQRSPIVLVNGTAPSADADTLSLLEELGVSSVTIAGGPNSVSTGLESSLGRVAEVKRLSGADRFSASIAINRDAFAKSSTVYLATGLNFPDALAGGVLAGQAKAPLYVVPSDCVPRGVIADLGSGGATTVVLLGGENSLRPSVASLTACSW